jgi:hypothetical protein
LRDHYPEVARQYSFPILFPLDIAFLLVAGGAMLLASFYFARVVGLSPALVGVVLALPLTYVAFDLLEDGMLAMMLNGAIGIAKGSVLVLSSLTVVKMASFFGSAVATVVLTVWGLYTLARPAS